jgi:hypothetical protein
MKRFVLNQSDVYRNLATDVMKKIKDQRSTRQMHILDKYQIWWFPEKGWLERRHKIGADNTRINYGDYTWKHSTIASGATTIGSAESAPDDIIIKLFQVEIWRWGTLYLSLYSKNNFFYYSLGGYSHRERWARTRCYLFMSSEAIKVKEDSMKRH